MVTHIGIGCIGFVFGYLLYYSVRHTEKFDITLLSAAIGAVGGEVVIGWLGQGDKSWIGSYGIGLFVGFVTYLGLTLYFVRRGGFDKPAESRIFFTTLLGTKPEQDKK
jgi:hypothetical protein